MYRGFLRNRNVKHKWRTPHVCRIMKNIRASWNFSDVFENEWSMDLISILFVSVLLFLRRNSDVPSQFLNHLPTVIKEEYLESDTLSPSS